MNQITIAENEELVMKLLHYFISLKGYNPIIIHGVQNEIWLENLQEDYKIVRIVSNYIHNNEQFKSDLFKTKVLMKNIKKRTLSFKMTTLSIFVNLGDNVHLEDFDEDNIAIANVKTEDDLNKYQFITTSFPDINKNMNFKEKGLELFLKLTKDINDKNEGDARMSEDVFSMKKPIITYILIAINVIMFIVSMFYNLLPELAVNRYLVTHGEFYRLITGTFLHANIVHLIFNMYALYIIGMQLESFLGKGKYLAVYLLSALAGSVLSIFMSSGFSVGASGAIFGLMGSLIYFGYHYRVYLDSVIKSQIIPLVIINLLIGFFISGIDIWAHIGGLIGGILATMAVGVKYKSTSFEKINGWILYLIYTVFILYMVFNGLG